MENTVTMTLEDYTNLIKENLLLKEKMQGLKREAKYHISEEIKDSLIDNLTKEQTVSYLEGDKKHLIERFTNNYSWTWREIADKTYVLNEQEVKEIVIDEITKKLNCHLKDLLDKEAKNDD